MSERQTPERLETIFGSEPCQKGPGTRMAFGRHQVGICQPDVHEFFELCVDGPRMNMTNLHFHGLHVSPGAPGDDF